MIRLGDDDDDENNNNGNTTKRIAARGGYDHAVIGKRVNLIIFNDYTAV